ncbi:MAG: alanine dehydrogenase [Nitrospirae bacterium]|nr:alanine dehydrogenase [Nitrospirota bacterium]
MIIGIPKEIKEHEYRVGATPSGVAELIREGHRVIVGKSAGMGSGFSDEEYLNAGAEISDRETVFAASEFIVKVKEPLPSEYSLLKKGQALFTFLHLASNPGLVKILLEKHITGFAYETLEAGGALPLLQPMSEIAGKMAPVMAAYYMQKIHGGSGLLLTGAAGVSPARVLILGAGIVGMSALKVAHGMGADITVINRGMEKLKRIDELYHGKVKTLAAARELIESEAVAADALIGAVYITGARTPKLVSRELVSRMKKGAVIVDVSVDQGGCVETTRPTTHGNPVYSVEGVIHYSVANMPGAYPRTSTLALTSESIKYIAMIANAGIEGAVTDHKTLRSALNTYRGEVMNRAVADSMK